MDLFEPVSGAVSDATTKAEPWILVFACISAAATLARSPRVERRSWAIGLGLFAVATGLRVVLGVHGPWHVNGQGPLWIRGALIPGLLSEYGPGYAELYGWIAHWSSSSDVVIFRANLCLSALAPTLLFGIARSSGLSMRVATAASCTLVFDPVLVRGASTESYFVPIITFALSSQLLLLSAASAYLRREIGTVVLALLASGLFASATARIHPAGYLPLAVTPLVVLGVAGASRPLRFGLTLAASAVIASTIALTSGQVVAQGIASIQRHGAGASLSIAPEEATAVFVVGATALWAARRLDAPAWLGLFGLMSALTLLATRKAFGQHPLWQASYDRLWLGGIVLGVASVLPAGRARSAAAFGLATCGVAVPITVLWPHLKTRTTEQVEYGFLREQIRRLPAGCVVAAVRRAGRRTVDVPDYAGRGILLWDLHEQHDTASVGQTEPCIVALRTSICASREARSICAGIGSGASWTKVANVELPGIPSYQALPYDRRLVTVSAYRRIGTPGNAPQRAEAPPVFDRSCPLAVSSARARQLFERLVAMHEADGCRLVNLSADAHRVTLDFRSPDDAIHRVQATPRACRTAAERSVGHVALTGLPSLEQPCRLTAAALERELTR